MSERAGRISLTFQTRAPADAPETKGYTCYFQPKVLAWTVDPSHVRVYAQGPSTRVQHRQGAMSYDVEGGWDGDTRPAWLPLPVELLAIATLAVLTLDGNP